MGVWRLFGELLKGYIVNGYLFFFGHLLVLYFVIRSWRRIRQETKALQRWGSQVDNQFDPPEPNGWQTIEKISSQADNRLDSSSLKSQISRNDSSQTMKILDQFLSESKNLGSQGFFVPMTDFSDRLDSTVDGIVAELHDRTNLFLLVGIAGTLFGVFEFAFQGSAALSREGADRVLELGKLLSTSMAKAFPVGFVGLLATFFAQLWATRPEDKLRSALLEATRKALKKRGEYCKTQSQIVSEAVDRIDKAMKPLENLEKTLKETIEPVITAFGERLDQSLKLLGEQFSQLREITGGVKETVKSLQAGVSSLKEVPKSLDSLLKKAPAVLENLDKVREHQLKSLQAFDASLESHKEQAAQISAALNETLQSLKTLPEEVISRSETTLNKVIEQSVSLWSKMSGEFSDRLHRDYQGLLEVISDRAGNIEGSVSSTLEQIQQMNQQTSEATEKMRGLPDKLSDALNNSFSQMRDEARIAWNQRMNDFVATVQEEYTNYVSSIQKRAGEIEGSIRTVSDEVRRVSQESQLLLIGPVAQIIDNAKQDVSEWLSNANLELANRYSQAREDILFLSEKLNGTVSQIKAVQDEFNLWLKSAEQARDMVGNIHETMLKEIQDAQRARNSDQNQEPVSLLRESLGELKAMSGVLTRIQQLIPSAGNGDGRDSLVLLSEIKQGLTQINDAIINLANKQNQKKQGRIRGSLTALTRIFQRKER